MTGSSSHDGSDGTAGGPRRQVVGLDHVVLRVADVERSVSWYSRRLGLPVERLEEWRRGEAPFVSMRVDATTIMDLVEGEPDGVNVDHVALVLEGADLHELAATDEFEVVFGPRPLSGAQGTGTGMYVLDPDGHRIELRTYP